MGFFSRLATFFRIRAESALNRAEDPGQVMDYSYGKQLEQLQNLKRSIADVVTNEKRLEMQQSQLQQQMDKLDGQALQALQANREDLARMALQRKETLLMQINGFEQQIAQLREQETRLVTMERQISSRVEVSMQARANAMDALIEQGTLGEQGLLGPGSNDPLERELHQISAQQNVEAQLQAMKQQMQLGGSKSQPRQLEGPDNY